MEQSRLAVQSLRWSRVQLHVVDWPERLECACNPTLDSHALFLEPVLECRLPSKADPIFASCLSRTFCRSTADATPARCPELRCWRSAGALFGRQAYS